MSEKKQKVPKLRFPGFTGEWEQRKLCEVAEITMGQSPSSKNYTDNPEDFILVQGNADLKNGAVVPRLWTKEVTKTAEANSIILTVRAPVGEVAISGYDVVLGRGVAGIKGNDFIYYVLLCLKEFHYWEKLSSGSTFDSINSNDIKEILINMPNEKEQEVITGQLKNIDNLITLHLHKLENLKLKKKALLQKLFPKNGMQFPELRFPGFTDAWEQRKLGEILKVNSGKDYKHLEIGDIPVYGTGGYMLSVNEALSEVDAIGIGRKGTIDKPQYLKAPFWTVDTLFYLVPLEEYSCSLLYHLSNLIPWKKFDESTGVPSLSKSTIDGIQVNIPKDKKEQDTISKLFDRINNLITLHQRKLEHLQLQKKALLQQMFV